MKIHNIDATGSFTYNGVDLSSLINSGADSGSFSTQIDNLNQVSSSLNSFTSSINTTIKNKLNSDSVISGSVQVLITGTTGYSDFSSSISSSIGSLSGSVATTTLNLSSSVATTTLNLSSSVATTTLDLSSSLSSSIGSLSSSVATTTSGLAGRITTIEGRGATTGSNTFIGTQTITGSLFISSNLIVQGSSSLQDITASAVNIGANIVNLNTANPAIRFAGMNVFDSGSIGGSGSFLYDAVQDEFIFVHRGDNANITSSVVLMGPQTYNNVGNETYPTNNRILKGTGNEHVGDSIISETDGGIGISGSLSVTGSINTVGAICSTSNVCFGGNGIICGNLSIGNYGICPSLTLVGASVGGFREGYVSWGSGNQVTAGLHINSPGTNLEITTGYNERIALSTGTGLQVYTNNGSGTYTSRMLLDRSGNTCFSGNICAPVAIFSGCVGIGIASPGAKLHVASGNLMLSNTTAGGSSVGKIIYRQTNSSGFDIAEIDGIAGATVVEGILAFNTKDSGGTMAERLRITSTGIACFSERVCVPLLSVGRNAGGDTSNYSLTISRYGDLSCSHAYVSTPAFLVSQFTNSGPTTSVDTSGVWNLALGRSSHTMACARFATLMHISYDGAMGPLRVDGRGNMFIGYDRSAQNSSNAAFSLLVACGIAAGSYQYCVPPNGGALFSGNVGIGVASPGVTLDVNGSIYSSGNLGVSNGNQSVNAASSILYLGNRGYFTSADVGAATIRAISTGTFWYSGTALSFSTNPGPDVTSRNPEERLRITSDGNVGIGIQAPTQRLTVDGLRGQPGTSGTSQNGLFRLGTLGVGYGEVMDMGVHVGVDGPSSYSWIQSTNQGNLAVNYNLALNPNGGNVGVGTRSPNSLLTVTNCNSVVYCSANTLINGQWLRISNPNGTAGVGTGILFEATGTGGNGLATISGVNTAAGSAAITFGTRDAGSNVTERMRLTSDGNLAREGFDYHTGTQWYKIPFYMQKETGTGIATTQCLVIINNNDAFQELHFTIEYGSRLQGFSDSFTQTSLRTYGVNRFVGNTITLNDVYIITGGSGCAINTHAPMSVAVVGNCMSVVKVDFSSTLGGSSFVWGEVRIWSIEPLGGKITVQNNFY